MRTCDVSEPLSLFPLRHVPRCHEKGMHVSPPPPQPPNKNAWIDTIEEHKQQTQKKILPQALFFFFYAEGRWLKELCKRAFKTLKWLWSAHNGSKNATLDKGRPLPHHFALQWWIRTDAWTWAGFGAAEAPPRPPLGRAKGTELGDTLEPQPRASEQSGAANYPRHT